MNNFPTLAMARFSQRISEQFKGQDLISMHNTNPQPFTQPELEQTIGRSFADILQNVNLGFAPDAGTLALRQTLSDYHYETIAVDEIITHAGAQEALFCVFYALLNAGDKVLSVAPVFEPLVQIPINIGCDVSYVHLDADNEWSLNLDDVEENFIQGCKMFIINFPHNPTGATLSECDLKKIVSLCNKHDVWLLSDEVFRGLEHSPDYCLPAVADLYHKGISIGVISKGYGIPGIRIGWFACKNKSLIDRLINIKGYISVCNSQIDELLASVILKKHESLTERNQSIILPNKVLVKELSSLLGHKVTIYIPNVGCCVFARLKNGATANALVETIINQTNYLLYPSNLFKTKIEAARIGFGVRRFVDFKRDVLATR